MTNCWFGGQWYDDASLYAGTLRLVALLVLSFSSHILLAAAAAATAAFAATATLLLLLLLVLVHFLRNLWAFFTFIHFTVNLSIICCLQLRRDWTRLVWGILSVCRLSAHSLRLIDFCACICAMQCVCAPLCMHMGYSGCTRRCVGFCVCVRVSMCAWAQWKQATECVRMAVRSFCLWAAFYYERNAFGLNMRISCATPTLEERSAAQRTTHSCMWVWVFVCVWRLLYVWVWISV